MHVSQDMAGKAGVEREMRYNARYPTVRCKNMELTIECPKHASSNHVSLAPGMQIYAANVQPCRKFTSFSLCCTKGDPVLQTRPRYQTHIVQDLPPKKKTRNRKRGNIYPALIKTCAYPE
jgi:hypothetical protein